MRIDLKKPKTKKRVPMPSLAELESELKREKYKRTYLSVLRSTIYTLVTVAATAVLIAVLLLPVLQIYGSSMTPTLTEGNIVISVKGNQFDSGDMVAFYYNNKILIKRVIGQPGQWIDIEKDGTVFVDGNQLDEPYVSEKAVGECDIELPYCCTLPSVTTGTPSISPEPSQAMRRLWQILTMNAIRSCGTVLSATTRN